MKTLFGRVCTHFVTEINPQHSLRSKSAKQNWRKSRVAYNEVKQEHIKSETSEQQQQNLVNGNVSTKPAVLYVWLTH